MNLRDIIENAGYKYSSFYVHIRRPDLPFQILERYGKAMSHDFTEQFPEMAEYVFNEDPIKYSRKLNIDDLKKEHAKLQAKYDDLNDKYRNLLAKYSKILEEKLGIEE